MTWWIQAAHFEDIRHSFGHIAVPRMLQIKEPLEYPAKVAIVVVTSHFCGFVALVQSLGDRLPVAIAVGAKCFQQYALVPCRQCGSSAKTCMLSRTMM